jgi:hypothetical protein
MQMIGMRQARRDSVDQPHKAVLQTLCEWKSNFFKGPNCHDVSIFNTAMKAGLMSAKRLAAVH